MRGLGIVSLPLALTRHLPHLREAEVRDIRICKLTGAIDGRTVWIYWSEYIRGMEVRGEELKKEGSESG